MELAVYIPAHRLEIKVRATRVPKHTHAQLMLARGAVAYVRYLQAALGSLHSVHAGRAS